MSYTTEIIDDDVGDPPWEREDGHGVVSDWTRRAKRPGERVLHEDRGERRYYDVPATMAIALRDRWGGEGRTPGERAAYAVEEDFARLRAWCRNEWCYVGIVVRLTLTAKDEAAARLWGAPCEASLCGIESDCGEKYFAEIVSELLNELNEIKEAA